MNDSLLKTQDLGYTLRHKALIRDINLTFRPGRLYGIIGLNGSGKSTLLKNLAGIWMPTAGHVLWQGKSLLNQERYLISRSISLVPQNPHIHFDYTVEEFVTMGRYPHDKTLRAGDDVVEMLSWVDVLHLRKAAVTHISDGERQRVYIARALVTQSPVLLLDEPTASLDIRHQLLIWTLLRGLLDQGKIVVVTLHDLHAAEHYCDEVALLHDGECIGAGSFSETLTAERLRGLFGIAEEHPSGRRYTLSQ